MAEFTSSEALGVAESFLNSFNRADLQLMRGLLADDLEAHVTNKDGLQDVVRGGDAYIEAIQSMHLDTVRYSVTPTQAPVVVDPDRVLIMVEVRAESDGRSLHNFAAHLMRVRGGVITELHMVDAKPLESDGFWS